MKALVYINKEYHLPKMDQMSMLLKDKISTEYLFKYIFNKIIKRDLSSLYKTLVNIFK